jgi:hypothetical protein
MDPQEGRISYICDADIIPSPTVVETERHESQHDDVKADVQRGYTEDHARCPEKVHQ